MTSPIKKYSLVFLMLCTLIVYIAIPLPEPLFPEDYSVVILDRSNEILRVFLNKRQQWHFPPDNQKDIPKKLKKAVLQFEDSYFEWHPGVNPIALVRALWQNISSGEILSGASTITMQVTRLMHPKPRTYLNKTLEILQALKIETIYSKDEIFKLYLNHAPYGGNVVGYRAASLRYFRKMPHALSWAEAAVLAVLPNAPGLISPTGNHQLLLKKRNRLLYYLMREKIIDKETYELACLEAIPDQSHSIKMTAPHLARQLKNDEDKAGIIKTTIDKTLQKEVGRLVKEHAHRLQSLGIENASAILVETQSGALRAYVGSQDFFDKNTNGQVDGVQAPRSSGSIFKPFLYALSMDEGIILPSTLIKDIPTYFGPFSPANADQSYRGIVSARQALTHSLNVPAVRLLNKYGLYSFYYFLKESGISTLFRKADDYGLPLIIGGAETTLWDLAAIYRGLARGGEFQPVKIIKDHPAQGHVKKLISSGAAYLTLEILRDVKRPGVEYFWQKFQNQWPLAWKTGTSYGQRDAWAVGVNPQWTIAVWAGNFKGSANNNLTGSGSAGPLLFDIFEMLPKDPAISWFNKPESDLRMIDICSETGFIAGDNCPDIISTEAPRHMKPMVLCPYHKKIFMNKTQSEQVCSLCWDKDDHPAVSRLIYPPDVSQFLRQSGQIIPAPPPHRISCPSIAQISPVKIIYPHKNAFLWIPRDLDGVLQKISLRAAHQQKNRIIYWYLDKNYMGNSKEKHVLALQLTKGWHDLEVVDEAGNRDRIRFYANRKYWRPD